MGLRRNYLLVSTALAFAAAIIFSFSALLLAGPISAAAPAVSPLLTTTPSSTPVCGLAWQAVTSPNPGPTVNLRGVGSVSPNDVWAVGDYDTGRQLLTMHWNGTDWSVIPNPNPGGNYANFLYSVSGVA